jgi:hypothetical protein
MAKALIEKPPRENMAANRSQSCGANLAARILQRKFKMPLGCKRLVGIHVFGGCERRENIRGLRTKQNARSLPHLLALRAG